MSKGNERKFPCLSPIGECVRTFISTNGRFRVFDRFLTSLPGGTYTRHPSLSEVVRDSDQFFACVRDGSLATRVMDLCTYILYTHHTTYPPLSVARYLTIAG